jgi:short-subunit dehydrogenase
MKNALITGATKGIGRAIAIAFANEGISLAVCSRNEQELLALKEELLQINPMIRVVAVATDAADKTQLLAFAAEARKQLAFMDIVVNNLGLFMPASILDEADDAFDKQFQTNLMPAYHLYRFFGKEMIAARAGHIFNICSVAAMEPIATAGAYSVTKYALLGLNKVMRSEMQAHNVKVTAVIPGSTLTDSWKDVEVDKDKMVTAEDVAAAVICCYKMSAGANVDELIIRPVGGQI